MVSVVMPAYNAEKFIGRAIDSVLAQTYGDFEFIIIEDCSTDGTLRIIESYDDKRIRLFKNNANKGIAYSTNIGLRESRGEYIALLDDDDMAAAERLEIQAGYLDSHPEIDILGGRSIVVDEHDSFLWIGGTPRNNPKYIKSLLLFKRVDFMNGTVMMRKSFIVKNGLSYREGCLGMQDHRFFIESSKVGSISSVDKVLLYSRVHGANETSRAKRENAAQRAKKYFEFQEYSLKSSGYALEDSKMRLIGKIFSEEGAVCADYVEFKELVNALEELLRQAKDMNADYFSELEHVCRTSAAEQTARMKNFKLGMFLGNE